MDRQLAVDQNSALSGVERDMPGSSASRSATASVSAGIADANTHPSQPAELPPRFPGEDGGRSLSLAEMAHIDLDAALQLLAERAQYITGASGAAIALRRGEHNDMLCRASAGSNAPELGALLSMEYGLSGESVRTRQTMLCDDAESDPRVNREGCRQLGIASVVVMPIVSDDQVLGVFELFAGKPRAFEERDIAALQRLSEIVETAVKHAVAAQTARAVEEPAGAEPQPPADGRVVETARVESAAVETREDFVPAPLVNELLPKDPPAPQLSKPEPVMPELETTKPEPASIAKKPLFWSAAMQNPSGAADASETIKSIAVPPVLRNLQKCQACGFPVSQGRKFCVECEEKQWRGQRVQGQGAQAASGGAEVPAPVVAVTAPPRNFTSAPIKSAADAQVSRASSSDVPHVAQDVPASDTSTLFLSSAASSESWLAANKYILGALLVVATVIGAIVWLR
jgi:hypothetical protein